MTTLNREQISHRLKAIRNLKGWNQTEMGAMLGIGAYYGNIERIQNNYSDQVIYKIAEKLDIDADWLLYGTGESPIPEKLPTKTIDEVIPTTEEKKELAPAAVSVPEPEPEATPEIKNDIVDDYAEIINAEQEIAPDPPIKMQLIDGKFIVNHQEGISLCLIISRYSQGSNLNTISLESSHGPYRNEMTVNQAHAYADMIHFAADKVQEVLS